MAGPGLPNASPTVATGIVTVSGPEVVSPLSENRTVRPSVSGRISNPLTVPRLRTRSVVWRDAWLTASLKVTSRKVNGNVTIDPEVGLMESTASGTVSKRKVLVNAETAIGLIPVMAPAATDIVCSPSVVTGFVVKVNVSVSSSVSSTKSAGRPFTVRSEAWTVAGL